MNYLNSIILEGKVVEAGHAVREGETRFSLETVRHTKLVSETSVFPCYAEPRFVKNLNNGMEVRVVGRLFIDGEEVVVQAEHIDHRNTVATK